MRALLFPLLLASTCAAAFDPAYAPAFVSLKDRAPLHRAGGYSIALPPTGLWLENRSPDSIVYVRDTDEREATMFIAVEDVTNQQAQQSEQSLRDFVLSRVEPAGAAQRALTEPVTTRVDMDARLPGCVRWRQTAEDLLTTLPVTGSHPQMLSGGMWCVNAGDPAMGIHVHYAIVQMSPAKPEGLLAEGEAILAGLQRKTP